MNVSFNGYGENVLTFNSSVKEKGVLVKIMSEQEVTKCLENEDFIGITCSTDGEYAGVILNGYVEVSYNEVSVPPLGYCALVCDGSNKVKVSTTSKHIVRVIKVDTVNKTVGFIL